MIGLLGHFGGYQCQPAAEEEEVPGDITAAFPRSEAALRWCLSCQAAMVEQEWPEELLEHELGEELRIWAWGPDEQKDKKILHRGE